MRFGLILFLSIFSLTANAQSPEELLACKSSGQYDLDCVQRVYAEKDQILNTEYKTLMFIAQGEDKTAMRDSQRLWLASRDSSCKHYRNQANRTACHAEMTLEQIRAIIYTQNRLRDIYSQAPQKPFEGPWQEHCEEVDSQDFGTFEICRNIGISQDEDKVHGWWDEFYSFHTAIYKFETTINPATGNTAITPMCVQLADSDPRKANEGIDYLCTRENASDGEGLRQGIAVCGKNHNRLYMWDVRSESDAAKTCEDLMRELPNGGWRRGIGTQEF